MSTHDSTSEPRWQPGAPGSGKTDDSSRGLDTPDPKNGTANPSHRPAHGNRPRGLGDSELQEQPGSLDEAREPGVDTPAFDK